MRHFKRNYGLIVFLFLFTLGSVACCSHLDVQPEPPTLTEQVPIWERATVAFVRANSPVLESIPGFDPFGMPYCTGFFISPRRIVSAGHCFRDATVIRAPSGETHTIPSGPSPEGQLFDFVRYGDIDSFVSRVVGTPQQAVLTFYDSNNDIALLELTSDAEDAEAFFDLATRTPRSGETVYNLGHPARLPWSLTDGIISRVITSSLAPHAPTVAIQATVTVTGGSSGSPLISTEGQVVGVAVSYVGGVHEYALFISSYAIRNMLRLVAIRDILEAFAADPVREDDTDEQTRQTEDERNRFSSPRR